MPSHRYGNSAKALQHPPYVLAVVLSLQSRMQPRTQVHPEAVLMTAKVPSVDSNDQKGLGVVPEAEAEAEGATLKDVNPQGSLSLVRGMVRRLETELPAEIDPRHSRHFLNNCG